MCDMDRTPNPKLAQSIAWLREMHLRVPQEELAARLGVSKTTVGKWEKARTSPRGYEIEALAEVFGVNAGDLLNAERVLAGRAA